MSAENGEPIRPLRCREDFRQCVQLQKLVWEFDHTDLVSAAMLQHSAERGGITLGSFDQDGRLDGFVFSFPAPFEGAIIQHSHMLAVHPRCRDQGIGNSLKWGQYKKAQSLGNPLITWSFDPLEARNAHLNLNKLGVRVRRYYVNLYGKKTSSPLHSGLGTDRLLAEWHVLDKPLTSPAGKVSRNAIADIPRALDSKATLDSHRTPLPPDLSLTSDLVAIETPAHTQQMKKVDFPLAIGWRRATRTALKHYLEQGYSMCGLWVLTEEPIRTFYCLQQQKEKEVSYED